VTYEQTKKATANAVKHPRAGMRFHEMYSYWYYVLAVLPRGGIWVRRFGGHPANPEIENIKFVVYPTLLDFQNAVRYALYCDDKAFQCIEKEEIISEAEWRHRNDRLAMSRL
jgi:hypothetical protein